MRSIKSGPSLSQHDATAKLNQSKLNVTERSRTSRLPWRGQFSPELIDYLMRVISPDARTYLDPFCGSGTVLYEAVLKGRQAWGAEANPAAWHLACLATLSSLPPSNKKRLLSAFEELVVDLSYGADELFTRKKNAADIIKRLLKQEYDSEMTCALAAVVLLGMGDKTTLTDATFIRGCLAVLSTASELMQTNAVAECFLRDARDLPLDDGLVEAVITSPPYINVFNYHQNYRPAVELLGWHPLEAARSEIGANRKHRANRFLTVVQYAIDMGEALREMARVMATGAPLIMVVGRTSNVLGASFKNGEIMLKLVRASGSFGPVQKAERSFLNRFGETIFEDLLITHKIGEPRSILAESREIALEALKQAAEKVPEKNRSALFAAVDSASDVALSPLLRLSVPPAFRRFQSCEETITSRIT